MGFACVDESVFGGEAIGPYEWLRERLADRLEGYTGRLPWWFYCRKPDLRKINQRADSQVRIEVVVPPARVCVMQSWAWHIVRTQGYFPLTLSEDSAWRRAMREVDPEEEVWPLPAPWRQRLEASWERVFSPDIPRSEPAFLWDGWGPRGWSDCEAVMEYLLRRDVVQVDPIRKRPVHTTH